MDKYRFGEFICQKRKQLHMTQDDLGRKLGVTNKAVSKWETGETLPEIQLLELLASTLNVTIDELLTQIPPQKEVVVKDNKLPKILMIVFVILSLVLAVVVIVDYLPPKVEPIKVNEDNYLEYFSITPCEESRIDDLSIVINGTIDQNVEILNPNLSLVFTVNIYYLTNDGVNGQITYFNRTVNYDGTNDKFSIALTPKSVPSNFNKVLGFDVTYELEAVEGEVVR